MEYLIIGVGGAGCKFLDTCSRQEEDLPECLAVHTDEQILDDTVAEHKLLLGSGLLRGESTGGDRSLGQQAAEAERDSIDEYLEGVDILFLVTGLGGGTGTGVAPLIAEWSRERGATVLSFAIQPFFFEGEDRRRVAEKGLKELRDSADAVIQLSNQTIYNWANENTGVQDAFEKINIALLRNLSAIIDLLAYPGVVANVRFSDFASLLEHSGGICVMGYGEGRGENKIEDAIESVVSNPVLGKENIVKKASGMIIGILGGENMTVFQVRRIMEEIPAVARSDVHMFMGAVVRPHWEDRIGIALLAAENWEEPQSKPLQSRDQEDENIPDDASSKPKGRTPKQSKLTLQPKGKGCFNNVEPTYFDGKDLDIPTFQRKSIKLV